MLLITNIHVPLASVCLPRVIAMIVEAAALWRRGHSTESESGMIEATVLVVLVATLYSLYQWPYLRSSCVTLCRRVFRWLLGLSIVCIGLVILAAVMDGVDSIATEEPLYHAAATRDLTRAAELLEHVHIHNDVDAGRRVGPLGMISSRTPLLKAVAGGHTEMVAVLLKAGADPNAPSLTFGLGMLGSRTLLDTAATFGHTETVAALLEAGADPSTRMTLGLGLLLWGTPLFAAAVSGRTETVTVLLKAGANANAPGATLGLGLLASITPLNAAAVNGHTETVLALLEAGANPNAPGDTLGLGLLGSQTPLDSAADTGHTETVAALLNAGANPKAPGFTRGLGVFLSRTPLDSALLKGHHAAADLLRDAPRVRTVVRL